MKKKIFHVTLVILTLINTITTIAYYLALANNPEPNITFDLFTQKEPHSGRGRNQPSDMFGPQENVTLYALLYKESAPLCGKLVSFTVTGPISPYVTEDIQFYIVAETNCSGIAATSFSLQVINQTEAFGNWIVIGKVEVDGAIYEDTLTFRVGWIIEALSIRTIDDKLNSRLNFGIEGYIGIELSFRNNALVPKVASVALTLFDELNTPVNSLYMNNVMVPPGGKIQYIFLKMLIPKFAVPGWAKIFAVILDEHGVPYCPQIYTNLLITIDNPIYLDFIDISIVHVERPLRKVSAGEIVKFTVLLRNEGTILLENIYVAVYVNETFIASKFVDKIASMDSRTFEIIWNTSNFNEGNYIVKFILPMLQNEADLSDNVYTFSMMVVMPKPIFIHDIQILKVNCTSNEVFQGELIYIVVVIRNNGNATESTSISIYYEKFLIEEKEVSEISPLTTKVLTFQWNTTSVLPGEYRVVAVAKPVDGEINIDDNIFYGCFIKIKTRPPLITHDIAIVGLTISPDEIFIGEFVEIQVKVKNLGNEPECGVRVILFYNNFPLTTLIIDFIAPNETILLKCDWDTSNIMEGNYTIKGVIPRLEGEENVENNQFIDGKVWIKAPQIPAKKHDVAVTSLNLSKTKAYKGEDVTVTVQVLNLGDFDETFPLSLYANESLIWSYTVKDLGAGKGKSYSFTLKTVNLKVGYYVIWAKAGYVIGETNTENNILIGETLTILEPPVHYIHDIAIVNVQPCSYSVYIGQKLNITVTVKNLGNATENFNLTLYYDANILQKIYVVMLPPHAERTILFVWDTVDTPEGTYRLKAYAEPVLGEENVDNNVFEDGVITVLKPPPFIVHDVGVIGLYPEKLEVNVGETINVIVVVANLGNVPENVNLTLYYDSKAISTTTTDLTPYTTKELTIKWCTANLKPGKYLLSAKVSAVDGEVNLDNNTFTDGEVTIKPIFVASLFLLILPILILLAIVIFAIVFYYLWRKRTLKFKPQIVIISRPRI